jgi:2-polyprenyl-6-methoxyphenol hydroxylase-like FAD-dependent oxidoreductase
VSLEGIDQTDDEVSARFGDGQRLEADLLIGADGLRSTVRTQFLPDLKPYYPGYIAWRCLANESDLSASSRALMSDRYTVCVAPGEQGIGYPVPGPDHSMAPGKRQFNVVWYHPVRELDELPRLLTDDAGRYHANGIPPSLIRADVRQEMIRLSERVLAPQFAEGIKQSKLLFFQPIVDLESPRLVFGRVVVIGDAAFVVRPHVAMGVPKAAGDALALVKAIQHGGDDYLSALPAFEAERLRISGNMVARGRYLGSYMEAQLKSEDERRQAEQARVAETVMMETAAPWNYD